jgi:hypothetical protein
VRPAIRAIISRYSGVAEKKNIQTPFSVPCLAMAVIEFKSCKLIGSLFVGDLVDMAIGLSLFNSFGFAIIYSETVVQKSYLVVFTRPVR